MRINLDGQTVADAISALVERGAAMGLDVQLPDGIDISITNEVLTHYDTGRSGGVQQFTAPKHIAIRWHYKSEESK